MGLISIVLEVIRAVRDGANVTDVKADSGTGASVLAELYGASGDDSPPLPGDSVALLDSPGAGRMNVVGSADTTNEGVAEPGEVRRYARDADGAIVATIWMQGDGTIWISNANGGVIEMAPSGDVTINGVTIDTGGNISTDGNVDAGGDVAAGGEVTAGPLAIPLSTHTHTDSIGGPTTAPLP